jgi:hypothetical protein
VANKDIPWNKVDAEFCEPQMKKINKRLMPSGEWDDDMLQYCYAIFWAGRQAERELQVRNLLNQIKRADKDYEARKAAKTGVA